MQLTGKYSPTTIFTQMQQQKEGKGDGALDQQDFLNLLITQLKNQDPLNPMESADFMGQTTAFSQLDEMMNMNKAMQQMLEINKQMMHNSNSLMVGTNFIGKEIEFKTNTVTLGGEGLSNINFYLPEAADVTNSYIKVFNKKGELVSTFKPKELKSGSNSIHWNGEGVGGTVLADGSYVFEVHAYNAAGKKLQVEEFGTGTVKAVKSMNGVLYFDIGDGTVSSEYVYSVKEPKKDDNKPDEGSKPDKGNKSNNKKINI